MGEHEVQSRPFYGWLLLLQARYQRIDNKGVKIGEVVFRVGGIDALFDLRNANGDHERDIIQFYLIFIT